MEPHQHMENDEAEALKKAAPLLFSMKKEKNGFSVPDGYFDRFPSLVREKIAEPEERPFWEELLAGFFIRRMAVPAMIALLLLYVGWNIFSPGNRKPKDEYTIAQHAAPVHAQPLVNDVAPEAIVETLVDEDLETDYYVEEETVVEALEEEELLAGALVGEDFSLDDLEDESMDDITDEEGVIDYLLESGVDISSVINEL